MFHSALHFFPCFVECVQHSKFNIQKLCIFGAWKSKRVPFKCRFSIIEWNGICRSVSIDFIIARISCEFQRSRKLFTSRRSLYFSIGSSFAHTLSQSLCGNCNILRHFFPRPFNRVIVHVGHELCTWTVRRITSGRASGPLKFRCQSRQQVNFIRFEHGIMHRVAMVAMVRNRMASISLTFFCQWLESGGMACQMTRIRGASSAIQSVNPAKTQKLTARGRGETRGWRNTWWTHDSTPTK